MDSAPVKLSREELYEEVWTTPIHRLAVKYGLSDVGLAKACKRMNIPRPPRGHWRRLETGARVRRTPLPAARDGTQLEIEFRRNGETPEKGEARTPSRTPTRPPDMPATLSDPHPLVATTLKRYEKAKETQEGLLVCSAKRILDIEVSRESLDRALRIMDTLLKSWEAEGLEIQLLAEGVKDGLGTFLCDGEHRMQISLHETVEEYDPGPTEEEQLRPKWEWQRRRSYRATGKLHLNFDGEPISSYTRFSRRFRDGKSVPLENRTIQFWKAGVEYFEKRRAYLEAERRREIEREEQHRQWEREWELRRREEARRERERKRVEKLVASAAAWREAAQIRDFVQVCTETMRARGEDSSRIAEWTAWATSAADRIDPLQQGYPTVSQPEEKADGDSEE